MKTVKGFAKLGLILGITAALTACSDSSDSNTTTATPASSSASSSSSSTTPSDEMMRAAVEKSFKKELDQMTWLATLSGAEAPNSEMMPTLGDITAQGCDAFEEGIYRCTVERTINSMDSTKTETRFYYFHKSETGDWRFIY